MKHLAHWRGEFASWKGDETRRVRFLQRLSRIIQTHTHRDFVHGVLLDDYREIDAEYALHEYVGEPYGLVAFGAILQVEKWLTRTYPGERSLYVFEKGDADQDSLAKILALGPKRFPAGGPNISGWQ